jgi:asparagine synthase (glutamine-hydrolysing)
MCGIAGILGEICPENREALRRMNAALSHRGPDAEGYWESTPDARGWGAMLAHRRLSILDLSPSGAQPMVDAASGDAVVLNGEIYNYVELRRNLQAAGDTFRSTGDTEVMLRALVRDGTAALPKLRGMFALAFWDASQRCLTLARDPLGIKPLYVARHPQGQGRWTLVFASELRALLASGLLGRPRLNPAAVASVVWNGFTVAPETAVLGVQSLWPGEWQQFDGGGQLTQHQDYWTIPSAQGPSVSEAELEQVLRETVRLHLASDVPLGVFLSGGVDSSAVANLAQAAADQPVHTFTLAFEEESRNEGPYARRVAQAIGTHHQELVLTQSDFLAQLDTALEALDQPSFDGLNSWFMSHAVQRAGFKVALVGSGGDELFGGYTSFRDLPAMRRWSRLAAWTPMTLRLALAGAIATAKVGPSGSMPAQTRWAKLPDMVRRGDDLLGLYQMAYALFLPAFQQDLLARSDVPGMADGLPQAFRERVIAECAQRDDLQVLSVLEQRLFLSERLLRDTDAVSMSASIEVRLPLVDQVLLETLQRVPAGLRYQPVRKKQLLRRIGLKGLDPALFDRPKSGFELPFDHWLKSALGERIDATLRDEGLLAQVGLNAAAVQRLWTAYRQGAPGLYWSRVWAIYALVSWCRRHQVFLG